MALNFAVLDTNNTIENLIICDNKELAEQITGKTCIQISFDKVNFCIGDSWDETKFVPKNIPNKPFDSWILDTDSYVWNPPIEYPTDGKVYTWNEESISWVEQLQP